MTRTVSVQMDPIEPVDIDADSTFVMALEAQRRGWRVLHHLPEHLSLKDGRVVAKSRQMTLRREHGNHVDLGPFEAVDLADVDVVLLRQDPPFDTFYITTTHLLEMVHPKTLVVNDPASVRNAPEKLLVTQFPDLMPPTLITRDPDEVRAFRAEHRDIIVKPLFGNGGVGVFHVPPADENLGTILEMFAATTRDALMVQRYEPAVRQGDKRIILIEGEPVGAINRIPAEGDARANMHAGGKAVVDRLTDRDREICGRIGPLLRERGLILVGIDVIGDVMTEINVTSPTGLQEIDRYDGVSLEGQLWDAIEARLAAG